MKDWETALDERGDRAAKSLQDALAAVQQEASLVRPTGEGRSGNRTAPTEAATDPADLTAARERAGVRGRRTLLAAAAVVVVTLGVSVAVLRDADSPDAVATDPDSAEPSDQQETAGSDLADVGLSSYLAPGSLPEEWEERHTALVPEDAAQGLAGDIAVYGQADADDPWAGPLLTAVRYDTEAVADIWDGTGTDQTLVTIGDQDATLERNGDVVRIRPLDTEIPVAVVGYGVGRDEMVDAAAHLSTDPTLALDALPAGYEEIARGPLAGTGVAGVLAFDALAAWFSGDNAQGMDIALRMTSGLSTIYGPPHTPYGPHDESSPAIVLGQSATTDPEAAELIHMFARDPLVGADVEVTEVRGQPAYVVRGSDDTRDPDGSIVVEMTVIRWFEPSLDLVATVVAFDTDQAVIDQFIDDLEVTDEPPLVPE